MNNVRELDTMQLEQVGTTFFENWPDIFADMSEEEFENWFAEQKDYIVSGSNEIKVQGGGIMLYKYSVSMQKAILYHMAFLYYVSKEE